MGFVLFFAGCFLDFYFETEEYAELCSISEREEKREREKREKRERERRRWRRLIQMREELGTGTKKAVLRLQPSRRSSSKACHRLAWALALRSTETGGKETREETRKEEEITTEEEEEEEGTTAAAITVVVVVDMVAAGSTVHRGEATREGREEE